MITVHVHDLRLFGRHGLGEEERANGQDFLFDVELDVGERGADDRFVDAVDYVEVARVVRDVSDSQHFALLEALASAVADALERRFSPSRIRIRIRKPAIKPAGIEGTVGVTLERP